MAPDLWTRFHFRGKDLRGVRFNSLVVVDLARIHRSPSGSAVPYWSCKCDCGNSCDVAQGPLRSGTTKSCGHIHKKAAGERSFKHGFSSKKSPHPIYRVWGSMLSRCNSPTSPSYHNYGARGIKVCERWHAFENFKDDMLPTWKEGLSLDRRDNNGPYSAENCHWISQRDQCNNTRYNRHVEIDGVKKTVSQWSQIYGISSYTIISRLNNGKMTPEQAVKTPSNRKPKPPAPAQTGPQPPDSYRAPAA